ncbi:reverse transcriptase domain-containing protein [Tanacetum coccineum]|uniref:Reverse transcriptase domain-containing protein n=1 Tax=Tanacetum coccineum TaxID=301880 RepID=A0ABQ5E3K8_9ASTR
MLKFPVDGGIVTICSTILIPAECAMVVTSSKEIPKEARVGHENFKVAPHPNFPDQEPSDMTGVPRLIAEHRLNIREGYSPVRQKKRGQAPERAKAIQTEDCYPLPEIDWKVESLCGYPFKCFLDTYKGYHQIQMAKPDEEKTAFHTSQRVYCYTKMPFGQQAEMLRDIDETFRVLRKINMKLNPKKCMFGAVEGMFLGYMISPEGIKPCLDKTEVVLQLPSPRTIKEVQSLNGKLASLNRFLSKSAERSLPLFKTLKKCIKKSDFHWTPEAEQAFKQLKQHLSELPLLVAPKPKEELIVYMSASHGAISAVLMTERGTVQMPVYFVSRALQGPELNNTLMEKLVLSLVFAAKRLRSPEGNEFTYALRFQFTASNNEAEYEAPIAGLWIAAHIGVRNVHVSVDSKLVANQVLGTYVAKEENMVKYLEKAKSLISGFANFSLSQVPRSKNKKADALSKIASTSFAHLSKQVLVEILKEKSIQEKEVATVVEEEGPTWMTPIIEYLKNGTLPDDSKESSKLRIKARQYELLEGVLYRWSFLKPWLRCVGPLQADYVIREIHEGSCSMHAGPRSVWGIDIAGPFSEGPGNVKFFIVVMDYFTKWIETKAAATITGNQVKKFMWDNIVCRFGLLGEIVSDNSKQFSDNPFKDWCEKLNIIQRFASVKHPQSNGLVERANRSLGEGIKARLGGGNKN